MKILISLLISFFSILLILSGLIYDSMRKLEEIGTSSYDPIIFLYYFEKFQLSIEAKSIFETFITLNYIYYNYNIYSDEIKLAQELLNKIGFSTEGKNGYVDKSTTIAIRNFQIFYNFYPDGILHTNTLNKIKEISNLGEKGGFPHFENPIEGEIDEYNKESENHPNCESQNRCYEIVYYNQCDERWKNLNYFLYDYQTNLCKNGSLPVSLAMIVSTLSNRNVTPIETLNTINEYGLFNKSYYVMEHFMNYFAKKYNLNYNGHFYCSKRSFYEAITKEKNSDSIIITEMFPNYWKDEGNKRYTLITSKELNSLFFQDSNFFNGKNISENVDKFINNCYESYVFSRK
jgi:hypothetical protein